MIGQKILWVDLETTGTDETADSLIEIGALVTDRNLEIVDRFQNVIATEPDEWLDVPPVVLDMHTASGLMAYSLTGGVRYGDALRGFAEWIEGHFKGQRQIPLAGSGIAHFDRRWLVNHLESANLGAISDRFTYWSYDVGSARRFAKLVDADLGAFGYDPPDEGKAHRAMDDILDHLQEAVAICNMFAHATATQEQF